MIDPEKLAVEAIRTKVQELNNAIKTAELLGVSTQIEVRPSMNMQTG